MAAVDGGSNGNGHPRASGSWDRGGSSRQRVEEGSVSGRRFVVAAIVGLLLVWGAVYLAFRDWRARYRALAEFGASQVAPLVDPLADRVPPGVDPEPWRVAVADTRAMLVALTGSGLLDRSRMEAIRDDLAARVACATPETALRELIALWDDLEAKAGPVISPDVTPARPGSPRSLRHPRPPRPAILKAAPARSGRLRGPE